MPPKKTSCEPVNGVVALIIKLDLASRDVNPESNYSTPRNLALELPNFADGLCAKAIR